MNYKPDPRTWFHREQALTEAVPAYTTWLPPDVPRDVRLARAYWLTRGSRGISWHRSGRASRGPLQ
jgi:hypothetical protein